MTLRRGIAAAVPVLCVASLLGSEPSTRPAEEGASSIQVLFTPGDDGLKAIVDELNAATRSIYVQARVLTSRLVADALIAAKQRGVGVWVLLDAEQAKAVGSQANRLVEGKIPVHVDGPGPRTRGHVMLIDRRVVITGSLEFSEPSQAEDAHNLLVIKDHAEVVRRFTQNWATRIKDAPLLTEQAKTAHQDEANTPKTTEETRVKGKAASGADLVYVTPQGKRYHRADCQFARNAVPMTREEAIKSGKTACKVCQPD